jgi:hypothetical protein
MPRYGFDFEKKGERNGGVVMIFSYEDCESIALRQTFYFCEKWKVFFYGFLLLKVIAYCNFVYNSNTLQITYLKLL